MVSGVNLVLCTRSNNITVVRLPPYINVTLLSITFITDVAMTSHVTYTDGKATEQQLRIFCFQLQLIFVSFCIRLLFYCEKI